MKMRSFLFLTVLFCGQPFAASGLDICDLTADYIIIGAGTAGCVLADQLSQNHNVILLEAGVDRDDEPLVRDPVPIFNFLTGDPNPYFWDNGFSEDTLRSLLGRASAFNGKLLGGGSSVGNMIFLRGTVDFFDRLAVATIDLTWGSDNAIQVLKDLEDFDGVAGQFNPSSHGFSGPVDVRQAVRNLPLATLFTGAASLVTGVPLETDYNDPATPVGAFNYWQLSQQPSEIRESSSTAYLDPIIQQISDKVFTSPNRNLTVYTTARVERILFSGKGTPRASGVQVVIDGEEFIFQAGKKVIISAGFRSPNLLQYSGIGDGMLLSSLGIPVIFDNPNVGGNLLSNPAFLLAGFSEEIPNPPGQNPNDLWSGVALTPDPTQVSTDRAFAFFPLPQPFAPFDPSPGLIFMAGALLNAKSVGEISIRSTDPLRMPIYTLNPFGNPEDLTSAVALYGSMYFTLLQMGAFPINFLTGAPAPDPGDTMAVEAYILSTFVFGNEWVGACSMAPSASGGVVDSSGNVFGVKDLVVADCSICPLNYLGNQDTLGYLIGNIISSKLLNE